MLRALPRRRGGWSMTPRLFSSPFANVYKPRATKSFSLVSVCYQRWLELRDLKYFTRRREIQRPRKMYRDLMLFLLAIGWCRGAIMPNRDQFIPEPVEQKEESVHEGLFPNSRASNQQQSDALPHENRALSSNQYFYPSYSEYGNSGYSAKTGYEGYLVPEVLTPQRESHWVTEIATSILPFSAEILVYGARVGASILHLLSTILVGGAFTTIICTFTPICSISFFGFGLSKQHVMLLSYSSNLTNGSSETCARSNEQI